MIWLKSFWASLFAPQPSGREANHLSPRAQQALAFAYKEAMRLNHNFIGTEHILLGFIALGQGTAVTVLTKMGLQLDTVRLEVEKFVGIGDKEVSGQIPSTPRVKKALALAAKECKALHHKYVGTEHILLGLLREGDGVAARVLKNFDVEIEDVRQNILKELDPTFNDTANFTPRSEQVLKLAHEEADRLKHNFIGTEHLLLGLIKLRRGIAFDVLVKRGLNLDDVVREIEQQAGAGLEKRVPGPLPHTPAVKRALALAEEEREAFGHSYVGTEHILLGLLRDGNAFAARMLRNLGLDIENTRQSICEELDPNRSPLTDKQPMSEKPQLSQRGTVDILEAMKRLIQILKLHSPEHRTLDDLARLIDDRSQWSCARDLFERIRQKTLQSERHGDKKLHAQYLFEEVCAKTLYNLSGKPAPFDVDSPFWIIPNALAAARYFGIDDKDILKALHNDA